MGRSKYGRVLEDARSIGVGNICDNTGRYRNDNQTNGSMIHIDSPITLKKLNVANHEAHRIPNMPYGTVHSCQSPSNAS